MNTLLAGDIGGTKTILRLVEPSSTSKSSSKITLNCLYEKTYSSQEYIDLVPMVMTFLEEAEQSLNQSINVKKACFGIAGPVINNTSELTNLSWSLSAEKLEKELSIKEVNLINDFAAVGYGILGLEKTDVLTLQDVEANSDAPIAVIGAGTGLGQGFLIPVSQGSYRVFNSEGGHADFAPRTELEFQLMKYVQEKYNFSRVSVERIVSGLGISAIYQFLREKEPKLESDEMKEIFQTWQSEVGKDDKTVDLSSEVAKASQNNDYLACQTMKLFMESYGAEAGNLAIKLLPYGGLYVAGGIAAKNLALMQEAYFMKTFLAKGRMQPLLEQIPVHVILNPKVGLIGAAIRASQTIED